VRMKKQGVRKPGIIQRMNPGGLGIRVYLLGFAAAALLMVSTALIELHQSKKELLSIMQRQAHQVLEMVLAASRNAISSNELLEHTFRLRLLNNAVFIRKLYEEGKITSDRLSAIATENHLYRINIFRKDGKKLYSSHSQVHTGLPERMSPEVVLAPIFRGETDTLFIGLKPARFESGFRYAVAVAAQNRSAIVVNLDAATLLRFRQQTGFGNLLRNLADSPGVVYAVLQDSTGILAAAGNVKLLERADGESLRDQEFRDSTFVTRLVQLDSLDVLEAIHPFYYGDRFLGMFRLGLSAQPLVLAKQRVFRRILIISLALTVFGFILFSLILVRQHLDLTRKQYRVVETYSGQIIEHVSDAVVVFHHVQGIRIFNRAAEQLFGIKREDVEGKPLSILLGDALCLELMQGEQTIQQVECRIQGNRRNLIVSRGKFTDEGGEQNTILVIRDITRLKELEERMRRQERLTAMGKLASGVAHEIRNPLNAISTTVQQLARDFLPQKNADEYQQLMKLVHQEILRINRTVSEFLRFARPEPLAPEPFILSDFVEEIRAEYKSLLENQGIRWIVEQHWDGEVVWDRRKIRQVLMNLIQNAADVTEDGDEIRLIVSSENGTVRFRVQDTGPGIAPEIQPKVFDLYFTTKARGTGMGLAIVQRIVDEHGGRILLESQPGKGTTFEIILPVDVGDVPRKGGDHFRSGTAN